MEIGSFIDLELPVGHEYYSRIKNVARLNTGRAAIYHAAKTLCANTVWLPHYQCETVRNFLGKKGIEVKYYRIDNAFNPLNIEQKDGEAVVIVNYFGIMSKKRLQSLAKQYKNVIIDNSQSFFTAPIKGAMNVYSARKFVGAPDGAYVIGEGAQNGVGDYPLCHSSDTSAFLLMRSEYGCEGRGYEARNINEDRIDNEDIMQMSALTRKILDGADYKKNISKRKENFKTADKLFRDINKIDARMYYDKSCVPMVYPLVVEDDELLGKMLKNKHFQGHWWAYVRNEVPEDSFEYWLSRYIIPITIDQRYGREELEFLRSIV